MRIGGGWHVFHLSDRVVELRNPDYLYHRFTGRPGFVRVRVEPQMTRDDAVNRAIALAQQNDEALALRATKQLVPSLHELARYQGKQVRLSKAFATPEDPEVIGAKRF
jgi:hypothetical protein